MINMNKNSGFVHIYCGNGKGKTTASVGLTVRAAGYGDRVLFVQFMKTEEGGTELKILRTIEGISVMTVEPMEKFTFQMTDEEKAARRESNAQVIREVEKRLCDEHFDMVVLDECLDSIETELLEENMVIDFIKNRDENVEVVLTGRSPSEEMIELSDYVSKIEKVKHPFEDGISSDIEREGTVE